MIRLNNITKKYGKTTAIEHLSMDIENGEFLVLLGPSGSGKSTLLNLIAGLINIDEGELYINDTLSNSLPPSQRQIGMIFQDYALYENMSVYENLSFGLKAQRVKKEEIERRILSITSLLGLSDKLHRLPESLSGGEQQRVAIGRALVKNQSIILMDEPLSHLDIRFRDEIMQLIKHIHKERNTTVVYVTHDQQQAMILADRIAVINQGVLYQTGNQHELYLNPVNQFVAEFIGYPKINKILGQFNDIDVSVCFRPEAVKSMNTGSKCISFVAKYKEHIDLGSVQYSVFNKNGTDIFVKLPKGEPPPYDVNKLFVPCDSLLLFDSSENRLAMNANGSLLNIY